MSIMKLKKFLKKNKITKTKFAQDAEITRQTLYNLLGGAVPSVRTIKQIIKATNGAINFDDF